MLGELTGLAIFAFVSSITPGPNNLMLMASGANFGFLRTLPHMMGVGLGFMLMIIVVGVGLVQVFDAFPVSYTVLKIFSVVYLCWLAWKIANASAPEKGEAKGRPFTFLQAALFQWVNPKAWAMGLTATTVYAPSQDLTGIVIVTVAFGLVNIPSISAWTLLGRELRRFLNSEKSLTYFNRTMAILLVLSLFPVLSPAI